MPVERLQKMLIEIVPGQESCIFDGEFVTL